VQLSRLSAAARRLCDGVSAAVPTPRCVAAQSTEPQTHIIYVSIYLLGRGGSVAEWLACWAQAQKGPGSNRSRDAVG